MVFAAEKFSIASFKAAIAAFIARSDLLSAPLPALSGLVWIASIFLGKSGLAWTRTVLFIARFPFKSVAIAASVIFLGIDGRASCGVDLAMLISAVFSSAAFRAPFVTAAFI